MNPYIQSLRLRTLPLSMSGIILGSGLAYTHLSIPCPLPRFWWVFGLAILTTLSLQILSNLCNELGDALKGTDTDQQGREAYGLQAGTLTFAQIKKMIWLFVALSIVFGTVLVLTAFHFQLSDGRIYVFLGLGLLAIIGAATYTLGKHSYGYMGLGDLGVFLFFGLLSTLGAYYLQTHTMNMEVVWCSMAIGLPCVGVLHLNNIRDMTNDRVHGKRTVAAALGVTGAKCYHTGLLTVSLILFGIYGHWWGWVVAPVWIWHLWFIWTHEGHSLDAHMPVLMLSTGLLACLGWL